MDAIPLTAAEQRATAATTHPAFRVNLMQIRSAVYDILQNWRGAGFFTEYTDHSFDHVLDMLNAVDWIIPGITKGVMTDADWLLLVLAIYFHDLGLLITKAEFDARGANPDYQAFLGNSLLGSEKHREYEARLNLLGSEESDRFQYQEYVRYSHGKRVAAWIDGSFINDGGATANTVDVLSKLVSPLDSTFRKDLARTCLSHTLDDIDDTSVYKISRPYGGEQETANVQYVAIILRTVDLIQISRKRAPSVLYQIISPANPLSQIEWQKQGGVRAVRPADARDREGNVTDTVLSDTIEVHATFEIPAAFFGLTSYLSYAEKQLGVSYLAVQKSAKETLKPYRFPWRYIDAKNIDTIGFLTESFEFELDQHKILDLLTGHTLYNNSTVVLRELTQNALDAVRLQSSIDGHPSSVGGKVEIRWNSADRSLTVTDNGTGMSQSMIVNHLLKVGSSRYQDPKFKEAHPKFHSISRFGIGVLSAFMVSDDVEITTCHVDEDKARRIALQSVHGKYLIKLLDKVEDASQLPMLPHGTSVRIVLRPTAEIGDVLKVARNWLMFPRCKVSVIIDSKEPIAIGYETPRGAIESYIESSFRKSRFKREYEVREVTRDGVSLAFAVAKDDLFGDWGFVNVVRTSRYRDDDELLPVATCIEGVAVEQATPGFKGQTILAVANAVGSNAPKTNVARSALEDTEEHRTMLKTVYELYAEHVSAEIDRLAKSESYSLSRAVSIAPFIASSMTGSSSPATKPGLLSDAMAQVPFVLLEDQDARRSISLVELARMPEFTTVESPLYRSIEYFVKEAPADVTARSLLTTLGNKTSGQQSQSVVCNITSSSYLESNIRQRFDIYEVTALESARAIEIKWRHRENAPRWFSLATIFEDIANDDIAFFHILVEARDRIRQTRNNHDPLNVPLFEMKAHGLDSYGVFVSNRERYLKSGTELVEFFLGLYRSDEDDRYRQISTLLLVMDGLAANGWNWEIVNTELLERVLAGTMFSQIRTYVRNPEAFVNALQATPGRSFDAFAWDRRDGSSEAFLHF